jgi:hypothetical protein
MNNYIFKKLDLSMEFCEALQKFDEALIENVDELTAEGFGKPFIFSDITVEDAPYFLRDALAYYGETYPEMQEFIDPVMAAHNAVIDEYNKLRSKDYPAGRIADIYATYVYEALTFHSCDDDSYTWEPYRRMGAMHNALYEAQLSIFRAILIDDEECPSTADLMKVMRFLHKSKTFEKLNID